MATFTKAEILALGPCSPWNPIWVQACPFDPFTGPEMEAYIETLDYPSPPYPWLMGSTVALATEFIEVVGRDVNQKDVVGNTALHWAVVNLDAPLITYLLSKGASKVIANNNGITPEKQALLTGNVDVMAAMGV